MARVYSFRVLGVNSKEEGVIGDPYVAYGCWLQPGFGVNLRNK